MNKRYNRNDILKHNLVNRKNQVNPNYDLSKKEVYFKLYFSHKEEICIVGELDNNYIVWCSLTKLSDWEINTKIFDYIASGTFKKYSQESIVLGREQFMKIHCWFRCTITKPQNPNRCWETPFGHGYGNDKENHGKYFSKDIQSFYNEQLVKSKYRVNEGKYLDTLKNYYDILSSEKEVSYYYKIKPLISILESESYLRLCADSNVRELYLKCMEKCSELYNSYMTAVR